MQFMDIKPKTDNRVEQFYDWMNATTADFTQIVGKKIEVKDQPMIVPEMGELRIKWYTQEAQAEQSGEIVTVEQWNGEVWKQYGLDAHDTVEDLMNLNWTLRNSCEICGADEMTARCNNADCV